VRYIRVYSAICWMVGRIDEFLRANAKSLTTVAAKQVSDAALEKIQLMLSWANQGKGRLQLAGSSRQFPADDTSVRLRFEEFGSSRANLLDAVAYRPSITRGLGFLELRTNAMYGCTSAGTALALAFDLQAQESSAYTWLADVKALQANRPIVLELEDVLDVGRPSKAEQQAFLQRFFPVLGEGVLDQTTQNRWLSLQLVLRSVNAVCRKPRSGAKARGWASEDDIRACMARARVNGVRVPLARVQTVQAWWAVLQLAQLQRLALDSLFCAVEYWLRDKTGAPSTIADCAHGIAHGALVHLPARYHGNVEATVRAFRSVQRSSASQYEAASRPSAAGKVADIFQRTSALKADEPEFDAKGGNSSAANAYVALVHCAVEASNLIKHEETRAVLLRDGTMCSLKALSELVERMKRELPEAFIAYVVEHWVILRHFVVVADRSDQGDEKNRFRFCRGENGLEPFDPALVPQPPAFAQDRLAHMLILMQQSGLLQYADGRGYRLTAYGSERLQEGLK